MYFELLDKCPLNSKNSLKENIQHKSYGRTKNIKGITD